MVILPITPTFPTVHSSVVSDIVVFKFSTEDLNTGSCLCERVPATVSGWGPELGALATCLENHDLISDRDPHMGKCVSEKTQASTFHWFVDPDHPKRQDPLHHRALNDDLYNTSEVRT